MNETIRRPEKLITTIIIVVLVLLLLGIGISRWKSAGKPRLDPSSYQVVFLENNQQYFGHLKNVGSKYPSLTDVYYVRSQGTDPNNPLNAQFTLIKMGGEIHGPEDKIYLNWDHVLYWMTLKPDSQVVQGINQQKAQAASPPPPAPAPAPGPAPKSR